MSGKTKHDLVVEQLRARVEGSPVGSILPPERALAEEFAVARMTIRKALDVLERSGEVRRRRGAGTFTARPKLDHQLKITSFTDEMQRLGLHPSTANLGVEKKLAGEQHAAKLRISPDDEIWHIGRLRLADEEPIAIEWVAIPVSVVPGAEPGDFQRDSLYRILRTKYDITFAGGRQRMEAALINQDESEHLRVPVGSPKLFVDRVIWDSNENVIEHVRAVYRADRYVFTAALQVEG